MARKWEEDMKGKKWTKIVVYLLVTSFVISIIIPVVNLILN